MVLGRLAAPKAQDATAGGLQLRGTFRAVGQDQERAVQGQVPASGPLLARPVTSDGTDECAFAFLLKLCAISRQPLSSRHCPPDGQLNQRPAWLQHSCTVALLHIQ